MSRFVETQIHRKCAAIALASAAAFLLLAGGAQAATVYPAGGSPFTGGAEGWTVKSASCNVPLLCTASGGYDGADGNSTGSLAANSTFTADLLSLFKSTVVLESPEFKVAGSGSSTLQLQRQFDPGGLVELAPQLQYSVALVDHSSGATVKPITETLAAASAFGPKDGPASVNAGDVYSITITAETSSTVAGTSLLSGTTSARFDDVGLSVQAAGGGGGGNGGNGNGGNGGGNGGNGGNGLSDARLLTLLQSSSGQTAVLRGKRLFVKTPCSAKIGRACRVSIQGLLSRHKPATTKRVSKIAKGKAKTLVLKVKPKARQKLLKRKRLLFRETVHAGSAHATVYKRLKLIRR